MKIQLIFFFEEPRAKVLGETRKAAHHLGLQISKELHLPLFEREFHPGRGQYDAEKILSRFKAEGPDEKTFCVVNHDIFVEGFNYVFGLASPSTGAAILSLRRLISHDEGLFLERVFKETSHELGHLLELGHCKDRTCVMSFSNSILEVDSKGTDFCPSCAMRITASGLSGVG